MRARSALPVSALLLIAAFQSSPLLAAPSAADKAAAEALFQDGVALLQASKAEAACPKLAASQELDPALGTMLHLADCYDRIGKTASAWALFEEAASVAQARGEKARETAARERVADVGKRLTKIKIAIKGTQSTLVIKLNGTPIPRASWDVEIPVDVGDQVLECSAPGFITWTGHVSAPPGPATTGIEIPELAPAPEAPAALPPVSGAQARDARPATTQSSHTERTVGYVVGGAGVLSLVAAGITSYLAAKDNHDSLAHCRSSAPNLCSQQGLDSRNSALSLAKVSTVTSIVGGVLVAGGITLILIQPSGASPQAQGSSTGIRVLASALPGHAALGMEGSW